MVATAEHSPSTPAGFGCCQACERGGAVGYGRGDCGSLDVAEEEEEEDDEDDPELMQQTEESGVQDLTLGDWA